MEKKTILINVKFEKTDQNFICKSDREAQSFLNNLAESLKKHPWHLARKKVERLESMKDTWYRSIGRRAKTFKQNLKLAEYAQNIKEANEAWALIDPPGKVVVNISNCH